MLRKSLFILFVLLIGTSSFSQTCSAQTPSASQQMSGWERAREIQEKDKELRGQVEQPVKMKVEERAAEEPVLPQPSEPKFMVKKIRVTGVTLFPEGAIAAITSPYEDKEITFTELQQVADRITDLYRKNGYITSRAYVPAQKMEEGVFEIRVLESTIGDVQIRGNRHFSTNLLQKSVSVKKGRAFNYNDLKRDLVNMNGHPDRYVRATLVPGKEPGATDIFMDVKDSLPVHVSLGYNNYLSRFVRRNNYNTTVTHNNLLGRDDIFTAQYQFGDAYHYYYYSARYVYPVTQSLDIGIIGARSRLILGREFADIDAQGESTLLGVFCSKEMLQNDFITLSYNLGFDYKNVDNYILGDIYSQDRLRVVKAGFDIDLADDLGRTVISNDFNYGIPDLWKGTPENPGPEDLPSSRDGAGGKFIKDTLYVLRLQKLVFDSTLLWKNQFQFSPSTLTSTEQFQAGGPANNRGYTPGELVGDRGYSMTWELGVPPYFFPKTWHVPFSKSYLYDSVRIIGFYDLSTAYLREPQPGEQEKSTIISAGWGLRCNIAEGLSVRYEIGWPLTDESVDGKDVHQWVELTASF